VACGAKIDRKWLAVVNDVEDREFDGLVNSSYIVFDGPNRLHFLATRGTEMIRAEVTIGSSAH
jgi:hypothetical protein